MSFIHFNNVWKNYDDAVILEGVNLAVEQGEFVTVVGTSGCGKTTFLRLLLGEEKVSQGGIHINGQRLVDEPDKDRGIVFQRYSVFPI